MRVGGLGAVGSSFSINSTDSAKLMGCEVRGDWLRSCCFGDASGVCESIRLEKNDAAPSSSCFGKSATVGDSWCCENRGEGAVKSCLEYSVVFEASNCDVICGEGTGDCCGADTGSFG